MKKYLLILLLLLPCTLKAAISPRVISGFASSWLYQYDPLEYNLELHPYVIEEYTLEDIEILWDLNSDGIVNLEDFAILSQIDMTQMISDMEILKTDFEDKEDEEPRLILETLALDIYDKEQELGIPDFRLAKILLLESDFDVYVWGYAPDDSIDFFLFWESETQEGWISISWWKTLLGFQYLYEYEFQAKEN